MKDPTREAVALKKIKAEKLREMDIRVTPSIYVPAGHTYTL